jgi:AraC-like DNA-binding protein
MLSFFVQGFLFANFHIFKIDHLNPLFYLIISSVSLCDWPLMFLYVKKMTEAEFKLRLKSFVHFIPALIVFLMQIGLYIGLSAADKQLLLKSKEFISDTPSLATFLSVYYFSIAILFFQILFYAVAMIIKLVKHRRNILKEYSYKDKITLNWLFAFVILYLLYFALEIIIFLFPSLNVSEPTYFSIVSVHIFIVGIWGLRQREIYLKRSSVILSPDEVLIGKKKKEEPQDVVKVVEKKTSVSERKQVLLTDSQKDELAEKITSLMKDKKLYLNDELSLEDLASELYIHKNYISYVINEAFEMNFYNYINTYRIEDAKRMLLDKSFDNLSIEGIAKSCGYKSRNVFYPVFKKFEGVTPLEFKKKNLN